MTVSASKAYQIQQGTTTPEETTLTLLGTNPTGTPGAKRVLTHPDSENHVPITYPRNPDETYGMDNDAIIQPRSQVVLTEDSSRVVSSDMTIEDVVVRERWLYPVDASFVRLLLDYRRYPPAIDPVSQIYVTYQPRDLNNFTFNVVIVDVITAGTPNEHIVDEVVPAGGGEIGAGMQTSDYPDAGIHVKTLELILKLVSKVA